MECRTYSESLTALIDGELSPEEVASVEQHLETCSDCDAEYVSLFYSYNLVNTLPALAAETRCWQKIEARIRPVEQRRPFSFRSWFPNLWLPVGAAVLLVLLTASLLWFVPGHDVQRNARRIQPEQMRQVLQDYTRQRNRELQSRGAPPDTLSGQSQNVRFLQYNPFRKPDRESNSNPFKAE